MEKTRSRMIRRILLNYAFTFMVIELVDSSVQIIDGLIVSRYLGAAALASTGLASPSYKMVSLFCGLFAAGIQSVCSAAMGAGDRKKTDEAFSCGLTVTLGIAVLSTVLLFACIRPICGMLGAGEADPELYEGLYRYLCGWFFGVPGFILFLVLSPVVTLDGNKKLVTAAVILQSVTNVAGDYLSVAVFHAGTGGVGFATGLGFNAAAVLLVLNFFRKRSAFRFRLIRPQIRLLKEYFRIGLPKLTKYACKMAAPLLINRIVIAVGGSAAMAAMSVKEALGSFFLVIGCGAASSVNLLSQVFYSEKDRESLKETVRFALITDVLACTIVSIAVYLFAEPAARLYFEQDAPEYGLTVMMLRLFAFSILLNGVNQLILDYLQGTRKLVPSHLQTVSHRFLFPLLTVFLLGKTLGPAGLFAAVPLSELLVLLTYIIAALSAGRKKKAFDALLLLPSGFGIRDEDSLSFSVKNMEDVTGISVQIQDFCRTHEIDRRRSYFAALALEELAGNVVSHGFTGDRRKHSCEVRVMIEDGEILLRIRDDCRYFDLRERYETMKTADPASNVGIRLVYGIAKDVSYIRLLNTNTQIIRL